MKLIEIVKNEIFVNSNDIIDLIFSKDDKHWVITFWNYCECGNTKEKIYITITTIEAKKIIKQLK